MSALPQVPVISEEAVLSLLVDMRLLLTFPKHSQAHEWRNAIETAKRDDPGVYVLARQEIRAEQNWKIETFGASASQLTKDRTTCNRCGGAGTHAYQNKMRFCGCPAGEQLMESKAPLPEIDQQRAQALVRTDNRAASMRQIRELLVGE